MTLDQFKTFEVQQKREAEKRDPRYKLVQFEEAEEIEERWRNVEEFLARAPHSSKLLDRIQPEFLKYEAEVLEAATVEAGLPMIPWYSFALERLRNIY